MLEQSEINNVRKSCKKFLNNHPVKSMKNWMHELAEFLEDNELEPDRYGEGEYLNSFEHQVAKLLGKEKAIFLPTGTMAQQIALRIWSQRTGNNKLAMHPTTHLEMAEHYAYEYLQGLQRIQLGIPDSTRDRLIRFNDFEKLKEFPGTILLEFPQREIGGQLLEWDELIKIVEWARKKQIKLHLDGARIWETQPYYNRPLSEICELFDSVYVSFYKGLGGISGAMLLGDEDFIAEAKIWQRRMGGSLVQLFPMIVSAKMGMVHNLPKMAEYYNKAITIAQALNEMPVFETNPKVPQSNMFHLFIKGSEEDIIKAHLEIAKKTEIWLINNTMPSIIPSYRWTEISIASAAYDLEIAEIIATFQSLADLLCLK
jgi:threonine aldolase